MIDLDSINKLLDKKLISKNTYKHIKKIIDMFGHNNNLKLLKIDNNKIYVKVGNTVYYYCKFKNNGMQYCLNGYNNTLITSLGYIDINYKSIINHIITCNRKLGSVTLF